jgi:hypothetical protein
MQKLNSTLLGTGRKGINPGIKKLMFVLRIGKSFEILKPQVSHLKLGAILDNLNLQVSVDYAFLGQLS